MANSKIIIVEGAQGAGKTTTTDFIRHSLTHTNLYRLSGTSDSTKNGLDKSIKMYDNLMSYIKGLENDSINLLFDRTFFTEEIYCRLGFKEYSFTEEYEKLVSKLNELDFEIYYITLYLEDTSIFEKRLARDGKANVSYAKFNVESSINQQNEYLKLAEEIKNNYKNIKVYNLKTDDGEENLHNRLKEILNY